MNIEFESNSDIALASDMLVKVETNTLLFNTLAEMFLEGFEIYSKDKVIGDLLLDKRALSTLRKNTLFLWKDFENKNSKRPDNTLLQLYNNFDDLVYLSKMFKKKA